MIFIIYYEGVFMKSLFNLGVILGVLFLFLSHAFSEQTPGKVVSYRDFGAVGDGVTDDFEAICKAHAAANETGACVCAESGATYYIGNIAKTAVIQTNTNWKDARFILDDSKVGTKNLPVFAVSSKLPSSRISTVKTIKKNQEKLDVSLPCRSLVIVVESSVKRYIRYGANQNNGTSQTDVFLLNTTGEVDPRTPIIWDFNKVSSMTVIPMDRDLLTITGGHFTTIANQAESKYTYYSRGIAITRSNVVVDGLTHEVTRELDHGAPYGGFFNISKCADVVVQNCKLTGHKTYHTIGRAGRPVSMGSYDISVFNAVNVTFRNCSQFDSIHDTTRWGIFGSNFSKNITFDHVEFSRFDAHMGVTNATIKDSVLGHTGISLIGFGLFTVENTKVHSRYFISLRSDYGSTFDGDVVIRHCEFIPSKPGGAVIGGSYSGSHDFGYTCYMPRNIKIDGFVVKDKKFGAKYEGPRLFHNINPKLTSKEYVEQYPYQVTREVTVKNLEVESGKPLKLSDNPYMFRNVKVSMEK